MSSLQQVRIAEPSPSCQQWEGRQMLARNAPQQWEEAWRSLEDAPGQRMPSAVSWIFSHLKPMPNQERRPQ